MKSKKIGRNEKCSCGSGLKYKKCCLAKSKKKLKSQRILPQIHQLILAKYFDDNHLDIDSEKLEFEHRIIDEIDHSEESISKKLIDYLKVCEEKMQEIASKHTIYDILFWSRRLGPKNIFNVSEMSVMLYRKIQTLSIYKYGISNDNTYSLNSKEPILPSMLKEFNEVNFQDLNKKLNIQPLSKSIINIISDTIRLEILSHLYLNATQYYRIANKGGFVTIDKVSKSISHKTTKDLSFLIKLYDDRISKVNLFSMIGAYTELDSINEKIAFPHFMLNVDHKVTFPMLKVMNAAKKDELIDPEIDIQANYLISSVNLKNIYKFLKLFSTEFEEKYSFKVEDFMVFLGVIALKIYSNISSSVEHQIQVFNRAYFISNSTLKAYQKYFVEKYKELHLLIIENKVSESHFKNLNTHLIFNQFTLQIDNQLDLDLWTRGPTRFFYPMSDDKLIVDYTNLNDIIAYIVKDITSVDGKIGNRRAINFEESLINEITKNFEINNIWVCQGDITANQLRKEVDASFVIEDILYIIEAKAVNVSFGFDKGDKKALDFRINKMKKAIKEVNEKTSFIKRNSNQLNPRLPDNIKYICPIVVSSYPEYIWEKEDELFISMKDRMPRIITIKDIKDLKSISPEKVKQNSWVIQLDDKH